jgi:hypothetical protein
MKRAGVIVAIAALLSSCRGAPPTALPVASPTAGVAAAVPGSRPMPSRLDVDGDGTVGSQTDALLILRYVAGFDGAALVDGAVAPGCQRCTAEQITAYIGSL